MTREQWKELCEDVENEEVAEGVTPIDAFWLGYEFAIAEKMFGENE